MAIIIIILESYIAIWFSYNSELPTYYSSKTYEDLKELLFSYKIEKRMDLIIIIITARYSPLLDYGPPLH
jgi:hypothetical protein